MDLADSTQNVEDRSPESRESGESEPVEATAVAWQGNELSHLAPRPAAATSGDRVHHWFLLIASSLVILASFLLQVRATQRVVLPGFDRPLPGICAFRRMTGQPCPGCGLTRSFVSIAHGDLLAAWYFNPAGPLIFLVVAAQIPYRAIQLWRLRRGRPPWQVTSFAYYLVWIMVAALLGQWILRLLWKVILLWN